jgi:hypothetical protein
MFSFLHGKLALLNIILLANWMEFFVSETSKNYVQKRCFQAGETCVRLL